MQPEAWKDVERDLRKVTIRGVMADGRLTQHYAGPHGTTVVSLDGECAEFAEGEFVRVTMERM